MKLGVVGTGYMAKEILPLFRGWGIEVAALCGTQRSRDLVGQLCAEHQIPNAYCDYDRFLADGTVDTVYLAVPNFLHFSYACQALEAGKNVIVEKPMTSNERESAKLAELAKERDLFLFEAISTLYLPNYHRIREWLDRIGTIRIVTCNFSQYSSRYDAFKNGTVAPAFDPAKSGGALMDLNLYNLHYLLGLFGAPVSVHYLPNIEKGIDTSGILTLDFDSFKAVSIAAKDCGAPCTYVIQGTKGYILQTTPANFCGPVTLHLNDGTEETFSQEPASRLEPEFRAFIDAIESGDRRFCHEMLDHSVTVSRVQTQARLGAGILFPADEVPAGKS